MNRLPASQVPATSWAYQAGNEPLPGYCLVEPLGKGGFGEVWKCEVSGGLFKAIKFVRDSTSGAGGFRSAMAQELQALQWIKGIRHPFLLSIERIEVIEGTLFLVMELADQNLLNLFADFTRKKQVGIPRPLLLSLLREVAEVLDLMNFQCGLQHLDIKPHNIFLIGSHAKVGDFGLVAGLPGHADATMAAGHTGVTPLYAAPERLRGVVSRSTDQYSLAIVYQQMLTGLTPYRAPTSRELAQLHLTGKPDLEPLPEADRPTIARAMSRNPDHRFETCSEFIEALIRGERLPNPATFLATPSSGRSGLFLRPVLPMTPLPGAISLPALPPVGTGTILPDATRPVQLQVSGSTPVEFLPGYKLIECLHQTAIGDLWQVETPKGEGRLAHWLLNPIDPPPELIARLEGLKHPALVPVRGVVSPTRRLVLLTEPPRETLRQLFAEYIESGQPGIPREQLLRWLSPIAEALDWMASEENLPHLGVCPNNITLENDWPQLRDPGLIPLIWWSQRKAAAPLNARYAAPETHEVGTGEGASDQYSLGLIYAEMLTGVHPRQNQRGRSPIRLDLSLLSSKDRSVVARALEEDPAQRYPTCLAFLEALVMAGQDSMSLGDFPPVVSVAVLNGTAPLGSEPAIETNSLIEQILTRLAGGTARLVGENSYRELPGDVREYHYPIQTLPGVLSLKLEGFRDQWGGRTMPSNRPDTYVIHLIVDMPRSSLFQFRTPQGGIEIVIQLLPHGTTESRNREAVVRMKPIGENLPEARKLLEKQAPRLIHSLRTYIHPAPEHRTEKRHAFSHPLKLWVEAPPSGWVVGEALGMDLSRGGLRFALSDSLDLDVIYVEFLGWSWLNGLAVRARVCRRVEGEGCWEYGAAFE